MTHDIVVKQHGGRIDVKAEPANLPLRTVIRNVPALMLCVRLLPDGAVFVGKPQACAADLALWPRRAAPANIRNTLPSQTL